MENTEQLLQVGVISSTHGLKGEVKVFPTSSEPQRFKQLKKVLLNTGKELIELEVQGVKFVKKMVIVKFKGIDHINDIEHYKGMSLWVTREDAIPLADDEYFVADLIGLQVTTDEGHKGVLQDVIETGANDVYVVLFEELGEVLIPALKQCILKVDLTAKTMQVHLLAGLVE